MGLCFGEKRVQTGKKKAKGQCEHGEEGASMNEILKKKKRRENGGQRGESEGELEAVVG